MGLLYKKIKYRFLQFLDRFVQLFTSVIVYPIDNSSKGAAPTKRASEEIMCIFFDKSKKENGHWVYPSIMVTLNNDDIVTFNYVQYVFLQGDCLEFNSIDNNRIKTTNILHNVSHFSVQSI